jgi:hypothetical protein
MVRERAALVIYHDDGKTYEASRGPIGLGAQHQLIARLGPKAILSQDETRGDKSEIESRDRA